MDLLADITDDFNEDQSGYRRARIADHTMATEGSTYLPHLYLGRLRTNSLLLLSDREESYTGGLAEPARPHQLPANSQQYDVRRGRVFAGLSAGVSCVCLGIGFSPKRPGQG